MVNTQNQITGKSASNQKIQLKRVADDEEMDSPANFTANNMSLLAFGQLVEEKLHQDNLPT